MKTLHLILACLLLAACATTTPTDPPPQGRYQIHELDATGRIAKTYQVTTYVETDFPRCVSFIHDGTQVFLRGSYQIDEFPR